MWSHPRVEWITSVVFAWQFEVCVSVFLPFMWWHKCGLEMLREVCRFHSVQWNAKPIVKWGISIFYYESSSSIVNLIVNRWWIWNVAVFPGEKIVLISTAPSNWLKQIEYLCKHWWSHPSSGTTQRIFKASKIYLLGVIRYSWCFREVSLFPFINSPQPHTYCCTLLWWRHFLLVGAFPGAFPMCLGVGGFEALLFLMLPCQHITVLLSKW